MAITFDKLSAEIGKRKFEPVYFLCGEEAYFIDQLSTLFEKHILSPAEEEFNLSLVYGTDIKAATLVSMCRRYPMFSDYQVIIVKEAQKMPDLEEMQSYFEKPVPSTILVFCYKYKTPDKRKTFGKMVSEKTVYYESKRLSDDRLPAWLTNFARSRSYQLDQRAAVVLAEHVGSDLSRLQQEMQKLMINLPAGSLITMEHVDLYTGISKDFNVFELQKALGHKNIFKVNHIAFYMAANQKDNPIQKIIPILYSFFSKILIYHSLKEKSRQSVTAAVGIPPFYLDDFLKAASNYSFQRTTVIISILREYDMKSKGVDNQSTEDTELIREMLYRILH